MCLYIITQETGAALHRALYEREKERERLSSHFMFLSVDESMLALLTAHSTRSFKKHSHPLPLFSKANS